MPSRNPHFRSFGGCFLSLSLSLLLIDSSYMCISLYVSGLFSFLAFVWSDDIWKMEHTSAVLTKRYSELLS